MVTLALREEDRTPPDTTRTWDTTETGQQNNRDWRGWGEIGEEEGLEMRRMGWERMEEDRTTPDTTRTWDTTESGQQNNIDWRGWGRLEMWTVPWGRLER